MKTKVTWTGKMAFEGLSGSAHSVNMDAGITIGGENKAASPMEFIALGLAGCTGMDVLSILQKKRQNVTGFEVKVDAPRAQEYPQVFTSAIINYIVDGKNIDETAVIRAIELSVTKYCPVYSMLSKAFPMSFTYEIYEAGVLVKQGDWKP